jgi:hypothetical protein
MIVSIAILLGSTNFSFSIVYHQIFLRGSQLGDTLQYLNRLKVPEIDVINSK